MPNELAGITRCTVQDQNGKPCGATFAGPAHIILGQNGASRMMALLEKLVNHLMEHHKSYFMNVMLEAQQYQGLLFMMPFTSTDKHFEQQRDYLRWSVHQQTMTAKVTDEKIGLVVAVQAKAAVDEWTADREMELELIISRHFEILLREMRNALQEPVPPPNPLAPAAKPS